MDDKARQVRFEIFNFYLKQCRPPITDELAQVAGLGSVDILPILHQLEDLHHIVLYKHESCSPSPIAMAHPFSHLPTPYVVSQGSRSWWANCAWCAFGLAAMLSPSKTTVAVKSGSIGEDLRFIIRDDEISCTSPDDTTNNNIKASDCHVHFSIPPSKWWMDVRFACGTIHVFSSKQEALEWPQKHSFYAGEVLSLETVWRLSKAWYGDKHTHGYERKSSQEVNALFNELGMTSGFWKS